MPNNVICDLLSITFRILVMTTATLIANATALKTIFINIFVEVIFCIFYSIDDLVRSIELVSKFAIDQAGRAEGYFVHVLSDNMK